MGPPGQPGGSLRVARGQFQVSADTRFMCVVLRRCRAYQEFRADVAALARGYVSSCPYRRRVAGCKDSNR